MTPCGPVFIGINQAQLSYFATYDMRFDLYINLDDILHLGAQPALCLMAKRAQQDWAKRKILFSEFEELHSPFVNWQDIAVMPCERGSACFFDSSQ
jgi:hypothetical protein